MLFIVLEVFCKLTTKGTVSVIPSNDQGDL